MRIVELGIRAKTQGRRVWLIPSSPALLSYDAFVLFLFFSFFLLLFFKNFTQDVFGLPEDFLTTLSRRAGERYLCLYVESPLNKSLLKKYVSFAPL